jgi:uncharacterized membrane protein
METKAEPELKKKTTACTQKYHGWTPFIIIAMFVFVVILVAVGIGGPRYHDCRNNDCGRYYDYGLYCYDYCWYGHYGPTYGPGNTLTIFTLIALVFVCLVPLCWTKPKGRKDRRIFNTRQAFNDI